jgi:lipopolysaccharide transport system ATP-binding protein
MTVINVERLGKRYRLGMIGGVSLHEDLTRLWARARGRPDPLATIGSERAGARVGEEFWALRDVTFDVQEGEVLGIIGRNGAGKSTLLKILSQVTAPTCGQIRVRGRIASLLEVGTGFHSELTGRENIFLNGAILGMSKQEIRRKLDEIVAFSGIEEFIDTPVKRYSSGMNVRLAFAVAAHLEPEILVIDEVLAVGDAAFQAKCLGKMDEVASGGRTILFVSHDLANVSRLCHRGILLNHGVVETIGDIGSVIATYTSQDTRGSLGYRDLSNRVDRTGDGQAQVQSIELSTAEGHRREVFPFGSPLSIQVVIRVDKPLGSAALALIVKTRGEVPVQDWQNHDAQCRWDAEPGVHVFNVTVPQLLVYPDDYAIDIWVGDYQSRRVDYVKGAIGFRVVQTPDSNVHRALDPRNGVVFGPSLWNHTQRDEPSPVGVGRKGATQ